MNPQLAHVARVAMGLKALANVEAFARGEPLPDRIA